MSYKYLLDIALILLSTKVLSLITRRFNMPQVVGALLAGLLLGPAVFNILEETEFINQMAELGVIVLMFTVGMESNIKDLKESGKASFIIAIMGVITPLIVGTIAASFFNEGKLPNVNNMLQNIFIGTILTATSVSITVETLREMGKLSTKAGNAILGAAIIDDVLGIIALTVITSMANSSVNIVSVILKIFLFFIFSIIAGYGIYVFFKKWTQMYGINKKRFVIAAFVICLLMSYMAERFFGVADITGAFIAGLILSENKETEYIHKRFQTLSYMLLSPIFFASIGIRVTIPSLNAQLLILTIVITATAILTKVIGCGLGAKICGYSNEEVLQIGVGMVSRGEVTLIICNKGVAMGLMSTYFLAPIIIMVVIASIFTPIILKMVFARTDKAIENTKSL